MVKRPDDWPGNSLCRFDGAFRAERNGPLSMRG